MGFFERLLGRDPSTTHDRDGAATATESTSPSPADPEETSAGIADLTAQLEDGSQENSNLREQLGALYERAGDPDAAIAAYEASLAEKPRYGESYNRLMDLYNDKRSQAASAGDSAAINQWMSKIDELLATSKRIMRENY